MIYEDIEQYKDWLDDNDAYLIWVDLHDGYTHTAKNLESEDRVSLSNNANLD